jgi:hypothetical protein
MSPRSTVSPLRLVAASLFALAFVSCREAAPPKTNSAPAPAAAAVPVAEVIPPGLEKFSWQARSRDYKVTVAQIPRAPGQCEVKTTGATEEWSVNECLGDNTLLYFASADGSGLLVIDPLPSFDKTWHTADVVKLYNRGKLVASTNAGGLVEKKDKLRMLTKRFAWLAGAGGLPGVAPTYAAEDVIMGTTADGATFRLGFTAASIPSPMTPTEVRANAVLESGGTLTWTDDEGETHFTNEPRQIPEKYRRAAMQPSAKPAASRTKQK